MFEENNCARHPDEKNGVVLWITGLSGAGKSTLAVLLKESLRIAGIDSILLDGDAVRELLFEACGFDRQSRLRLAYFNARLCRFLSHQGQIVFCPTISLFHEVQAWNQKHIPTYFEVFLDVPVETLRKRDSKNIYSRFSSGELRDVIGLDIPAEFPQQPHLRLGPQISPRESAERIIVVLESRGHERAGRIASALRAGLKQLDIQNAGKSQLDAALQQGTPG